MATLSGRFAVILVTLLAVSACVTEADLKPSVRDVTANESDILFSDPSLNGGSRKFAKILAGDHMSKTQYAIFGPSAGRNPRAGIIYQWGVPNARYYIPLGLSSHLRIWNEWKEATPELGPTEHSQNTLGRAEFALFDGGGESCFVFSQYFGINMGASGTNQYLSGFYCRAGHRTLLSANVHKILSHVGLRNHN